VGAKIQAAAARRLLRFAGKIDASVDEARNFTCVVN
jgi:hypothetical protein